jgi:Mannosyltransferase (PIG-V)
MRGAVSTPARNAAVALLGSRLLVWAAGVGAVSAFGNAIPGGDNPPRLLSGFGALGDRLAAPAARWDAAWYLTIAKHGYQPGVSPQSPLRAVFFPFYPLLIRGLNELGVPLLIAGVLISTAALGAALHGLQRLVALERDGGRAATLSAWALALCPTTVFFSAVYTDSLYLALSIAVFLCARRGRWAAAALLTALAGATRNTGILLLAPLALLYLYGPRSDRRPDAPDARRLRPRYRIRGDAAWLALAPAGLVAYLAYWGLAGGDALAPLHGERFFRHHFTGPLLGLWNAVNAAAQDLWHIATGKLPVELFDTGVGSSLGTGWQNLVALALLVLALLALAGVLRTLPAAYGLYATLALLVPLSSPVYDTPLQGMPRYAAMLFPLWMWLGAWLARQRRLVAAVLGASALSAALLTAEFSTWHFVA